MTGLPIQPIDEELQTLQREVQRMLGRCLLRLQQYEKLMKAIVAHHEISASGSPLESNQAERIADAANKTLGTLVGTLLGTYVTSGEQDEVAEPDAPDNIISFKMKMSLRMSAEDFDTTQNDLKELVLLRNNLVHHFIDQHDLWSLDGCRGAQESLVAASPNCRVRAVRSMVMVMVMVLMAVLLVWRRQSRHQHERACPAGSQALLGLLMDVFYFVAVARISSACAPAIMSSRTLLGT